MKRYWQLVKIRMMKHNVKTCGPNVVKPEEKIHSLNQVKDEDKNK